ncbi:uncharacterized protein EDB91DRAFT_1064599, partial [Suillus paluster]|uniref:uncharacterized protein n=1 Tax=Suillus paluster TaxID=48578 RepID=UPI001B86646F
KLPISLDDLTRIVHTLGPQPSYDDSLFLAMLITGFKSLQCLGELVWPDSAKLQTYSMGTVPTCAWFLRCLHWFCGADFSGHSLRAGGAMALAAAGMAPDLICAAGQWSSDEFNKYIRQHPFLLHALMHSTAHAP